MIKTVNCFLLLSNGEWKPTYVRRIFTQCSCLCGSINRWNHSNVIKNHKWMNKHRKTRRTLLVRNENLFVFGYSIWIKSFVYLILNKDVVSLSRKCEESLQRRKKTSVEPTRYLKDVFSGPRVGTFHWYCGLRS